MADLSHAELLRRMIVREEPASAPEMTVARALTVVPSRVALDELSLSIVVRSAKERIMSVADLPEILGDKSLLLVLEGPQDSIGLMVVSAPMLAALVQIQTMGRLARIQPVARQPTRTDASMTVEFVDALLAALDTELSDSSEAVWASGFRYASWLGDGRPLSMILDDIPYRAWTIDMQIGTNGQGQMLWVIPQEGKAKAKPALAAPALSPGVASASDEEEERKWRADVEQMVMRAEVHVDAVLHRISVPLSVVVGLQEGTEIPLPLADLKNIQLESCGRPFMKAQLGQHKGMRAVRVSPEQARQAGLTDSIFTGGQHEQPSSDADPNSPQEGGLGGSSPHDGALSAPPDMSERAQFPADTEEGFAAQARRISA